ncbi:MAG: response regulator [Methylococcaceae bacterium]|nr:MAG: response regulator [Methylococcaceae bacterium]
MNKVKQRVLIIDDNKLQCDFLSEITRLGGLEPLTSMSPNKAIATFAAESPDFIVLDLCIPEMDGIEIMSRLAGLGCAARIILMSGHGRDLLHSAGRFGKRIELNIIGLLMKPFDGNDLLRLLQVKAI